MTPVLCGGLVAAGNLEERAWPAAWLGLALWIATTSGQPTYLAFRRWLLGGLVTVGIWFHWMPGVAEQHLDVSLPTALLTTSLAVLWDAMRFGVFGFLIAAIAPRGPGTVAARHVLAWPVLWVGLEWVWPHLFPWRLAHTQLGFLPLCQIAEWTGAYGVSFLLMWGAAAGAFWWRDGKVGLPGALVSAAAILVCAIWGGWRMQQLDADAQSRPQLRVALVQPGALDENMNQVLQRLSAPLAPQADVIIWGEGVIGYFAQDLASFHELATVQAASRYEMEEPRPCPGLGCPLLCGGGSFAPGQALHGPYCNTAWLIAADERVLGHYHKRILMPWGEYAVGQQWLPGLRGLLADVDPFVPGRSAAPLGLGGESRLGVLICYEDMPPVAARQTVREGANVLVNLNNLATFERTAAVWQHQRLARFRAIENRRWLVRCGTVGSTAVISATGRVVQQAPASEPATILAAVPLLETRTVYTSCGDLLALLCAVVSAGWLLRRGIGHFRLRKKQATSEPLAGVAAT